MTNRCAKCGYDTSVDSAHYCGAFTTSTMPRDMQPVSVETLKRAMQEIDLLPKPDQWILIDPQGRMYRGTVDQVAMKLMQSQPLMQLGR